MGGVAIYESDPIVRRATSLQQTSHAIIPAARVNANTLHKLGFTASDIVLAKQNQASVPVVLEVDNTLPENVVYLPHHNANAALGGLMNVIELTRA